MGGGTRQGGAWGEAWRWREGPWQGGCGGGKGRGAEGTRTCRCGAVRCASEPVRSTPHWAINEQSSLFSILCRASWLVTRDQATCSVYVLLCTSRRSNEDGLHPTPAMKKKKKIDDEVCHSTVLCLLCWPSTPPSVGRTRPRLVQSHADSRLCACNALSCSASPRRRCVGEEGMVWNQQQAGKSSFPRCKECTRLIRRKRGDTGRARPVEGGFNGARGAARSGH